MSTLDTLIREKALQRARLHVQLSTARAERVHGTEQLAHAEHALRSAQVLLSQLLCDTETLCVQRLQWTRSHLEQTSDRARHAQIHLAACGERVQSIEQQAARIDKELEKLEERRQQRVQAAVSAAIKHEHDELDDWVLARGQVSHG